MPNYSYSKESKHQSKVVETEIPATIKYVNIQSLIQSHLEYVGKASGRLYTWDKAGDTVLVLEEDSAELLVKRLGAKTCCGNELNKIFQLVS